MKKFIILIRKLNNSYEIYANKKYLTRTRNLGRCIMLIANHLIKGRITDYEVYGYERNRQRLIKGFDAQMIVDYMKNNKNNILTLDEEDTEDPQNRRRHSIDDDDDDDDIDFRRRFENDDDDDNDNDFRRRRVGPFLDRPIRRGYVYQSKDSSYDIEKIKDNLRNL